MRILFNILITLIFASCSSSSVADAQLLAYLKRELKDKENRFDFEKWKFDMEPEERRCIPNFDEFKSLLNSASKAYKEFKPGISNIKQINAFESVLERARPLVKHLTYRDTLTVMNCEDSISFYLFKNRYLSNLIHLQQQIQEVLPTRIRCYSVNTYNLVFPTRAAYQEGDTFNAIISPVWVYGGVRVKKCEVFRNNNKIKDIREFSPTCNFGPLKKGSYKLKIESGFLENTETIPREHPGNIISEYDFTVK